MILLNSVSVKLFPLLYADLIKICPWRRKSIRVSGEYNTETGAITNIVRVDNFECVDKTTEEKIIAAWEIELGKMNHGNPQAVGNAKK